VSVAVRPAAPDETPALARVLEGALLDVDAGRVRASAAAGEALRAGADGTAVGALVREGSYLVAVAVAASWRGRGVGRRLVDRAHDDAGRLVADCRPTVAGFYEACGFRVHRRGERAYALRA
jgi:GNAT superfamily N-acetyltransferase